LKTRYLNITIVIWDPIENNVLKHYNYCCGLLESVKFYIIIAFGGPLQAEKPTDTL